MKKFFCFIYLVFIISISHVFASNTDSLLLKLDQSIKERHIYIEQKENKLKKIKSKLRKATKEEQFYILGELLDNYRSFNTDSALHIIQEREAIAKKLNNKEFIYNTYMNKADVLGSICMYKEAIDLMKNVHIDQIPEHLHPYYYHIYRTLYGLMADYAVTTSDKKQYSDITDKYRDSLLLATKDEELMQVLIKADQYNVHNRCDDAIKIMTEYMSKQKEYNHNTAICTYTLSESFRLRGDKKNEKKYLIISSIADMQTAVREYISLRKLVIFLYQEGDIDRAYSYIELCMQDAEACNARLRKLEILDIFPIINDAYRLKNEKQQKQIVWALGCISILSILLIIAVFFVYKQMRKVVSSKNEVIKVNKRLKEMNGELNQYNIQLKEASHSIAENSYLKEEYIGRYMDQCSIYIEKMDNYRRSLAKIASSGKVDELYGSIKSSKIIDNELKDFYSNFDDSFLELFPTFVEDFNNLLIESERITLKPNEKMNTELRIFALIRLGITDSVKISKFLRYSVTTIYNYRTKVRNKAIGNRDFLEREVMNICRAKE